MALTAEKQAELLKNIGIDPEVIETIDAATDLFSQSFIKREQAVNDETIVNQIVGSRMGKLETFAKQQYKALGVEFAPDEIKGKKVEEILELGTKKASESWLAKEAELKKLGDAGEGAKAWEEKYSKLEMKFGDTEKLNQTLKEQLDNFSKTQEQITRESKIKEYKTDQIKDAKLKAGIDELTLDGFNNRINSKYVVDLDEAGKQFVKDAKTGTRIQSKKKPGDFAEFSEVFEMEARAFNLWSDSPHGGKVIEPKKDIKQEPDKTAPSRVSSAALKLAGQM